MAVSVVAEKLKIAETIEEAMVLQKYGIIAVDSETIQQIVKVLEELKIKGIDLTVTLRPEIQQPQPAQQSHAKAPFSDLDEDQRWALIKDAVMVGKKLSIFGEVVTVDPDLKVWKWNGQTFKSISAMANSIASATGRRGQWNGWAVLRITE